MRVIKGDGIKLAGARKGEHILITLTNGQIKRVIFVDVKSHGIEGHSTTVIGNPLKFYPYANILEVSKDVEKDDSSHVLSLK